MPTEQGLSESGNLAKMLGVSSATSQRTGVPMAEWGAMRWFMVLLGSLVGPAIVWLVFGGKSKTPSNRRRKGRR